MRSAIIIGVLGLASMAAFVHCSASPEVCRASECAALGPDATDASDGSTQPPICDPAKDPSCVTNENGVFVDGTNGDDTAAGTKEKPTRSISAALGKLGERRQVFICGEGPFTEHVKLTSAVSLYGGFSCGDWSRTTVKARVAPPDAGYALELRDAGGAVVIADMAFEAVAGDSMSRSSIGIFIVNSASVTLRKINVKASDGFRGADGADAKEGLSTPADRTGTSATETTGGDAKTCTCSTGGSTTGGEGGDTGGVDPNGTRGEPALSSPDPPSATGAGGTRGECESTGINGRTGSNGPSGQDAPSPAFATLDATGWHPGDGEDGKSGTPGQGGGGGGSYSKGTPSQNGGGSGGGCGGCGGGGGGGGKAGGSSIAALIFQSTVTIEASELISSSGAPAGNGKAGVEGSDGGNPGTPIHLACRGALGGKGGKGGAGAGGAGGVSAGIVYKGAEPVNQASTIRVGAAGAPGTGGAGNDGPKGRPESMIQVP